MLKQLVLLFFVFFLLAALVIAAIWTQIIPEYRAVAQLRIRSVIPFLVFRTEDNGIIPQYESFVNTQVSIMRSLAVLQRVLDQRAVQNTKWYKEPQVSLIKWLQGKPSAPPLERLRNCLSTQPRPKTEIIDVIFTDSSPKDAKIIVDAVLKQYMLYIGERFDEAKDILHKKISEQYTILENEIKGRETIIAALRNALGTGTPQELISSMRLRMDDTQARLTELQQNIAVLEWEKIQQAVHHDRNDVPIVSKVEMEKQPKYHEDSEWRALDINLRTAQHSIATSELEPNNPEIIRAAKDVKFAEELLKLREAQLDEQWRDKQEKIISEQKDNTSIVPIIITNADGYSYEKGAASLELQLARLKEKETLLTAEIEKQKEDFKIRFADAQALENENNELQHKRELFKAVRQRLDQKNMERNVSGRIEVLTEAFAPSEPHKDRRVLFTAIVLVLDSIGIALSGWLLHRHGYL
ncbi:MAG: hypothetical protein GY774_31845 [Planctomycetes bacterium]|nr:hypothetical protein [Planctomycetota bacterium]